MWAAVTLATRWHGGAARRASVIVWGLLAVVGIVGLVAGLVTGTAALVVAALVGPAAGAVVWTDRYLAGLVAGYSLPVVAVPAAVALAGYAVYWAVERAVLTVRSLLPRNRGTDLREPLPYQGRE